MDFSEVASVSGKGGLYRVLSPTRTGVILETLDDTKKKMIANMQSKVSILSDISIYTTDEEGAVPLKDVMIKIHKEFNGDTGLSSSSDSDELKSFLKFILPDYDEDRVYVSDIKKLVTWYNLLSAKLPELFEEPKEEKAEKKVKKAPKKAAKKPEEEE
ncbi:MAG: hypothetical protein CMB80_14080 [Flammeovirgaceae bacterium]|nr:hypothetical protein [Flammeovirgaceae bacterium]MBR09326.1 hypothetical protein [Rickettsiales bacterium]HCX24555.1 hypothetical protein [Cytophagales bacterium]|tara:strand:+ start:787 stop:1260 length:474 start_codon:yes stop_codon:yes gene_type:complete